jgi:2-polyprenyl-3-methyl-5-hydroxy-6-metoxy-1,4-benzoquinol methylase
MSIVDSTSTTAPGGASPPLTTHQGRQCEIQDYCDLCGAAQRGQVRARSRTFDVLGCERCHLLWTRPLYYVDTKATEATDDYWAADVYLANAPEQKKRFRMQVQKWLEVARPTDLKKLRVLDVGSGLGFLLDVCDELGVPAEGCDIVEKAVAYSNRDRARARVGSVDAHYPDQTFDAVFAMNLIEHLPHPRGFLVECRRVLKPGGMLIMETPVQESLFHKVAEVGYSLSRGRLQMLGVSPGGHIYKFAKTSFEQIGHDLGYRVAFEQNISSPFGEIWGKSKNARFDNRALYRAVLPALWVAGETMKKGNRTFIMLQRT